MLRRSFCTIFMRSDEFLLNRSADFGKTCAFSFTFNRSDEAVNCPLVLFLHGYSLFYSVKSRGRGRDLVIECHNTNNGSGINGVLLVVVINSSSRVEIKIKNVAVIKRA